MFCGKCGTKNDEGTNFCVNCGAKLNREASAPQKPVAAPAVSSDARNRKVGMIAVAVAVVVVLFLGFLLFGGRSAETTAKKFVKAATRGDAKAMLKLMPKKGLEYSLKQEGYDKGDLDKLTDELEDQLEKGMESLPEDVRKKISYKIFDGQEIKGDDLEKTQDMYKKMGIDVSAAKKIKVRLTVPVDKDKENHSENLYLIKIGRSWYIDFMKTF